MALLLFQILLARGLISEIALDRTSVTGWELKGSSRPPWGTTTFHSKTCPYRTSAQTSTQMSLSILGWVILRKEVPGLNGHISLSLMGGRREDTRVVVAQGTSHLKDKTQVSPSLLTSSTGLTHPGT